MLTTECPARQINEQREVLPISAMPRRVPLWHMRTEGQ